MYVVTEYQYQQLRNYCKEAFVDEIGRQPLNEESLVNTIKGLSENPAEAYQQGRRDGRAEAEHAAELADNSAMFPDVLVYDAEWPEISIQDWPPVGAVYVSRDCQHRLGPWPAWIVSTMGDGTLEGDTVHHGIFWQREDAELFAESKQNRQ